MTFKQEVEQLVDGYSQWLRDNTMTRELEDSVVITIPYLDRHNDFLDIVVSQLGDGRYRLSDDGYIIADLEASGCTLDTPGLKSLLNMTLNSFGVRRENNELTTVATREDFSQRKHNLIQAMLAVNDLFFTMSPQVKSLSLEDMKE